MKILRVSSDLYPAFVGGIAIHAHEMSKIQGRMGNEVSVYTSFWGDEPREELRDGYRVKRFRGITIFRNSIAPMLLYDLLRKKGHYDIIHAHSHLYFSTVLCALARRLGSSPLIITNHGLISQTAPLWLQNVYIPTVGKWAYKGADKVVCYTDTERAQLVNLGINPEKIVVIHNGVNTDIFSPVGDVSDKKKILWIGKYVPGKGAEYLINGFQLFSKNHPDYQLVMVGRGPLKDKCIELIQELGITDKIVLKDFVPNNDLPQYYRESRIFVLPSLEEGVPRTILEAMSCGVPVVCTRLPQLVDIVSGSGLLVPTKDPQAIADALSQIVSDPALSRRLGENGRKSVLSDYSWEDTVRKTLNLYRVVLDLKDQHLDPVLRDPATFSGTGVRR